MAPFPQADAFCVNFDLNRFVTQTKNIIFLFSDRPRNSEAKRLLKLPKEFVPNYC